MTKLDKLTSEGVTLYAAISLMVVIVVPTVWWMINGHLGLRIIGGLVIIEGLNFLMAAALACSLDMENK